MEDRLSELPESLLLEILSRLEMEDAVRTGAISTKWRNLWKLADGIAVHYPFRKLYGRYLNFMTCEVVVREFVSVVSRTLSQFTSRNIKRFSLVVDYVIDIDCQMFDELLEWAFLRNVEILLLTFPMSVYSAPEWFCHNSSLKKLDIEGPIDFKLLGSIVNWCSLKSLSLSLVEISDEDIAKVLSGCQVLESLVLNQVSGISKLNFGSSAVRKLRVVNHRNYDNEFFEVIAPWLEQLEISGPYRGSDIRLKDVSSLLKAGLTFECVDHFYGPFDVDVFIRREAPILESLCAVEELAFGRELIQVMSLLKLLGRQCPSFKCKHLTLHSRAFKHELPGITYLLQSSPFLETLVLEVEAPTTWEDNIAKYLIGVCEFDGAMYLSKQSFDYVQLKNIKISRNFYSCSHRDAWCNAPQFDFVLATHITRYARFMEKVTITSPAIEKLNSNCSRNCVSEYFHQLFREYSQYFHCNDSAGVWKLSAKKWPFEIVCSK
ncbi:F-box protein At5g03100-like isoform X2 [Andrographis paniculata]|uniref:F-box protein At5g03100-like isoform X2 n=1 Tax=Andrographis paniculata TaxID=175694 RepID=UPI0021E8E6AB|nr:F-box protein At5g03100-like isoform X2 [Andrographis paniculata]